MIPSVFLKDDDEAPSLFHDLTEDRQEGPLEAGEEW